MLGFWRTLLFSGFPAYMVTGQLDSFFLAGGWRLLHPCMHVGDLLLFDPHPCPLTGHTPAHTCCGVCDSTGLLSCSPAWCCQALPHEAHSLHIETLQGEV